MNQLEAESWRKYAWLWYAEAYITSTSIVLESLLSDQNIVGEFRLLSNKQYSIITVLYNIRHIFELIIKATGVFYDKNPEIAHDNEKLAKIFVSTFNVENDVAKQFLDIYKKYYDEEFYKSKFGFTCLPKDPQNMIFRYPEGVNEVCGRLFIDTSNFNNLNEEVLQEIKEDVRKMKISLFNFYGQYKNDLANEKFFI